jgi:MMPL family
MNLISIGASFGVVVWVFADGHLADRLGFTPTGFLEPTIPILMLAVLFGLATDYEVFLLSRVREAWDATGDNTASVAAGMQRSGGIITAAALLVVAGVRHRPDHLRQDGRARHDRRYRARRHAGPDAAGTGHHAPARAVELVGARCAGQGVPAQRHPRARSDDPVAGPMNEWHKYVVSTSLAEPLDWQNSTLVKSSVPSEIAKLKEGAGKDIQVMGIGELVHTLIRHDLID